MAGHSTLNGPMPIMLTTELRQRVDRGERIVIVKSLPAVLFDQTAERWSNTNHYQDLATIKRRGGFDAVEALAVLSSQPFSALDGMAETSAHRVLYAIHVMFNRGKLFGKGGYCATPNECVCGGDTPGVRAGCANWRVMQIEEG